MPVHANNEAGERASFFRLVFRDVCDLSLVRAGRGELPVN